VIIAAVLVVGGCGAVVATFGVKVFHEINGARETADDFLSAVERGDSAAAKALLCDEALPETVPEQLPFERQIVSYRVRDVAVRRSSGFGSDGSTQATADATADLTLAGGAHQREVLFLRREHNAWRVCVVSPPLAR
jgi:hypothetical protein